MIRLEFRYFEIKNIRNGMHSWHSLPYLAKGQIAQNRFYSVWFLNMYVSLSHRWLLPAKKKSLGRRLDGDAFTISRTYNYRANQPIPKYGWVPKLYHERLQWNIGNKMPTSMQNSDPVWAIGWRWWILIRYRG